MKYFLVLIAVLISIGLWLNHNNQENLEEYASDTNEKMSNTKTLANGLSRKLNSDSGSNQSYNTKNSPPVTLSTGPDYTSGNSSSNDDQIKESSIAEMDVGPSDIYSGDESGVAADDDSNNREPANE